VGQRTAALLKAKISINMKRFPTSTHLASWAGMPLGNSNESAGKPKQDLKERAINTSAVVFFR